MSEIFIEPSAQRWYPRVKASSTQVLTATNLLVS